jgi:hypothetical protein
LVLAVIVLVGLFWTSLAVADTSPDPPLADPIPESISKSGLAVKLEEVVIIPASGALPAARINYLTDPGDGSGRLFVPDLRGDLWAVSAGVPTVYLDVAVAFSDFVAEPGLGSGFGFVAFHPDFAVNGLFYTVHTEDGDALAGATDYDDPSGNVVHGVITEWTATDPSASTFAGSMREMLRVGFGVYLHGFQQIGFDPTLPSEHPDYGLLYISVGDGDETPAFSLGPRDLSVPHGKILRIDPLGGDGPNGEYGIPATNPFVPTMGALDEIWAFGLRNPHRFSWDTGGDQMFIANIGESNVDGVYVGQPGADYGWNEREGPFLFDPADPENVYPLPVGDEAFGYTYPVAQYDHDEGFALVGGFVSRSPAVPELDGMYVFGDIVNGRIFYADEAEMVTGAEPATVNELTLVDGDDDEVTMQDLAGMARVDLRFGTDSDGIIYVLAKANGQIWRITSAPLPPPPPTTTTPPPPTTTTPPPPPPGSGVACPEVELPFVDVSMESFAYDDVVCIFGLGVTMGTGATTYSPAEFVTREQMAAFLGRLWRVLGGVCPEVELPFVDVSMESFAYDDVVCIFGLGVTMGTGATTYSPAEFVTREQMAAFLARVIRIA